jgi:hypothetical protein
MSYWNIALAGFFVLVGLITYQLQNLIHGYVGTDAARKRSLTMVLEILFNYAEQRIGKDSWIATFLIGTLKESEESKLSGNFLKIPFMFGGKKYYVYEKYNGRDFRSGGKVYAVIDGRSVDLELCPGLKLRLKDGHLESTKIVFDQKLVDFTSDTNRAPEIYDPEIDDLYS